MKLLELGAITYANDDYWEWKVWAHHDLVMCLQLFNFQFFLNFDVVHLLVSKDE